MLIDDRGRSLTFGEYRDAAARAAAGLQRFGVGQGTVVSWQIPTSLEAFVLIAAISRLDAVSNPIIPILRRREVQFIANEVGSQVLIVPGFFRGFDYEEMATEIAGPLGAQVILCGQPEGSLGLHGLALPDGEPAELPPAPSAPDGAAEGPIRWLLYSSGTTANPKGVRHTDATIMAGANGLIANLVMTADDLYPIAFPVTHVGGVTVLVTCLFSGAQLGAITVFGAKSTPEIVAEMNPTILGSATPFLQAYIAAQKAHGAEKLYPRVRVAVAGGTPTPPELHYEMKALVGGLGIMSSWGLTEFPNGTHPWPEETDEDLILNEGRIAPGVEMRVVGLDGVDVEPGAEGELRIRGPQMFKGYVNPALNDDAFDELGFLRTGDLGLVSELGHVRITGRLKDIIIRNSENISALEVENLLHSHPQVQDVAVIGLPDSRTGERCCAIVAIAPGSTTLTLDEITAHCRASGLANQKIPEQLEIIDVLPRNAMGKLLKQQLRERYSEQSAGTGRA
jgi:acyl-CoA synthetase (AMP-forming)/AMP-acid ligase II